MVQRNRKPWSRTPFICSCKQLLTTAPQCHFVKQLILWYQNHFSRPQKLFEAGGAVFIMNSIIHLRKISLSAFFKAISHFSVSTGRSMQIIDQTSFTEFGGEIDGFHGDVIRLQSQKSEVLRILIYNKLKIDRK